ncbi:uncharacterized protein LOC101851240 [Aplysia californica]|uniref:Uncharacterized protein LOC101851240 n=1 Tax=Aplysia californica TaxID=6500 RepID=A0ABM1AEG2_APLCA|nr:uncharacterized protein LOC101851240 [Aplysia californica]
MFMRSLFSYICIIALLLLKVQAESKNKAESNNDDHYEDSGEKEYPIKLVKRQASDYPSSLRADFNATLRNAALMQLQGVESIEDLISRGIVMNNGRPLTAEDLSASYDNATGKMVIAGGGELAEADECSPREKNVEVNLGPIYANIVVFPRCLRVLRCGGCCNVPALVCRPRYEERKIYNLLQLEPISRSGHLALEARGTYPVEVVRHMSCSCECTLTTASCGPRKRLNRNQCRCECRRMARRRRCHVPKVFNPETCRCECASRRRNCCRNRRTCALRFNENSCRCELDTGSRPASSPFFPSPAPQSSANNQAGSSNSSQTARPVTSPTATMTLSTIPPAQSSSPTGLCNCPGWLQPRITETGQCTCTPSGDTRRRGRPLHARPRRGN